jgi:cysteine sulfinate desulfinase/cysteine desulfurase-like protein
MMVTYLDHAASTPMRHEAIEAMTPFLDNLYANPSGSHRLRAKNSTKPAMWWPKLWGAMPAK